MLLLQEIGKGRLFPADLDDEAKTVLRQVSGVELKNPQIGRQILAKLKADDQHDEPPIADFDAIDTADESGVPYEPMGVNPYDHLSSVYNKLINYECSRIRKAAITLDTDYKGGEAEQHNLHLLYDNLLELMLHVHQELKNRGLENVFFFQEGALQGNTILDDELTIYVAVTLRNSLLVTLCCLYSECRNFSESNKCMTIHEIFLHHLNMRVPETIPMRTTSGYYLTKCRILIQKEAPVEQFATLIHEIHLAAQERPGCINTEIKSKVHNAAVLYVVRGILEKEDARILLNSQYAHSQLQYVLQNIVDEVSETNGITNQLMMMYLKIRSLFPTPDKASSMGELILQMLENMFASIEGMQLALIVKGKSAFTNNPPEQQRDTSKTIQEDFRANHISVREAANLLDYSEKRINDFCNLLEQYEITITEINREKRWISYEEFNNLLHKLKRG